jgi:tetratricopeptide (TPR) repeat protein
MSGLDALRDRVKQQLRDKQWDDAVVTADRILAGDPDDGPALFAHGYALYCQDRPADALRDFERYLQVHPANAETLFYRGQCNRYLKNYRKAIADFDRVFELAPDDRNTGYNRALCYLALQQWQPAGEDLDRYLSQTKHPQLNDAAYLDRAWARCMLGDHYGAIADYDAYLARHADYIDAIQFRGFRRLDLKEYKRAIEDFERAIALDAKRETVLRPTIDYAKRLLRLEAEGPAAELAKAFCERGWAKANDNDFVNACLWFERAIEVAGDHAGGWYGRGEIRTRQERWADAIRDETKAIELDPKLAGAWQTRARAKRQSGDSRGAIPDYTKTTELDPDNIDAYYWRAVAHESLEQWSDAEASYAACIERKPGVADYWYRRGWVRRKGGRTQAAIADYSKAIELAPTESPAYFGRAYARADVGALADAIADARRAVELGQADAKPLLADLESRARKLPDGIAVRVTVPGGTLTLPYECACCGVAIKERYTATIRSAVQTPYCATCTGHHPKTDRSLKLFVVLSIVVAVFAARWLNGAAPLMAKPLFMVLVAAISLAPFLLLFAGRLRRLGDGHASRAPAVWATQDGYVFLRGELGRRAAEQSGAKYEALDAPPARPRPPSKLVGLVVGTCLLAVPGLATAWIVRRMASTTYYFVNGTRETLTVKVNGEAVATVSPSDRVAAELPDSPLELEAVTASGRVVQHARTPPGSGKCVFSIGGTRCFELSTVQYGGGFGGGARGQYFGEAQPLFCLQVDYWFESAPTSIKSKTGFESRSQLLEVQCR